MKTLNQISPTAPIHLHPNDTLIVIFSDENEEERAKMTTKIKTKLVIEHIMLVEYTEVEAKALGFKDCIGIIAGEKQHRKAE